MQLLLHINTKSKCVLSDEGEITSRHFLLCKNGFVERGNIWVRGTEKMNSFFFLFFLLEKAYSDYSKQSSELIYSIVVLCWYKTSVLALQKGSRAHHQRGGPREALPSGPLSCLPSSKKTHRPLRGKLKWQKLSSSPLCLLSPSDKLPYS